MKILKMAMILGLGTALSACGSNNATTGKVSKNNASSQSLVAALGTTFKASQINVVVPSSLNASELNRYLPSGDIVWRGDPYGDRHAQVKAIFEAGFRQGNAQVSGGTPVRVDIEVLRFHALTEKARYSTGGVHNIIFSMVLRDAATGAQLGEPRVVRADLKAFGGQEAIEADAAGQTQKVRITNHLAEVIRHELTTADGFKNPQLGLIQRMNKL